MHPRYALGALLAVVAGGVYNLGVLFQKKAVNAVRPVGREPGSVGLMRSLVTNRLWLGSLALQFALGTPLYLAAQLLIGPTLIPGLMATGLIVLALGSPLVTGEPIRRIDLLGVAIVVAAVALFGFSRLSVRLDSLDFLAGELPFRFLAMTALVSVLAAALLVAARLLEAGKGPLFIVASGLVYAAANLWLGVLLGFLGTIARGDGTAPILAGAGVSAAVVVATNLLSFVWTQRAFRHGRAAALMPLQQAPMQIVPAASYFLVFLQTPPSPASPYLAASGVALILIGSALLGSRHRSAAG